MPPNTIDGSFPNLCRSSAWNCVRGSRVVCLDRMRRRVLDEAGVVAKFGVRPASIPDWLALVGDAADGIPGIPGWGAKSAAAVLARYAHIDAIPDQATSWATGSTKTASRRAHPGSGASHRRHPRSGRGTRASPRPSAWW